MQQAVNLVPMMMPAAGQVLAQAGGQPAGQQALPGVFQAMLLEALLGAQTAAAPVIPGQAAAAPAPTTPAQATAQATAQAPAQAPPPDPQAATPAPRAEVTQPDTPVIPIRLTGPTPAPIPPEAPAQPPAAPLPEQQEEEKPADGGSDPAQAVAAQTLVTQAQMAQAAQVVQMAQAQAVQPQVQQAPAPPTPDAPEPPSPEAPPAAIAPEEAPDPRLEAFVQKAVRVVQGQDAAPGTESKPKDPKPTFHDLVKLVVDADQAPAAEPAKLKAEPPKVEEPAVPIAPNRDVTKVLHETPSVEGAPQRQPVDPEQVLRQVTRFVKVMVESKQSEVRLQLHPEHLGNVMVKLVVGEGALRANLVAQDAAVKAALEANLDQLRTRLTDQGFQVEQVHVTVGGDGSFSQPQHSGHGGQRQPQQSQQPGRQQAWRTDSDEQTASTQRPRPQVPAWLTRGAGARLDSLA